MTTYRIKLAEINDYGPRQLALVTAGPDLVAGTVRACFQRWGYQRPFLHPSGWDVAECWIDLKGHLIEENRLAIALPSELASHFEATSNYTILLELPGGAELRQGMHWSVTVPRSRAAVRSPLREQASRPALAEADNGRHYAPQPRAGHNGPTIGTPTGSAFADHAAILPALVDTVAEAEDAAWGAAQLTATRAGWMAFLLAYPSGKYAVQAKQQLAAFVPKKVIARTRWSAIGATAPYGIDICAFMLNAAGVVRGDADFLSSWATSDGTASSEQPSDAAIRCQGVKKDSTRIATESIAIDLDRIEPDVTNIALTSSLDVRIHPRHHLAEVDARFELVDGVNGEVLIALVVGEGMIGVRGRVSLVLTRRGNDWTMQCSTESFVQGIEALCARFGVDTT